MNDEVAPAAAVDPFLPTDSVPLHPNTHDVNEAGNFADKDDDEGETAEWEEQMRKMEDRAAKRTAEEAQLDSPARTPAAPSKEMQMAALHARLAAATAAKQGAQEAIRVHQPAHE